MSIKITKYEAICNLGNDIKTISSQAISGVVDCFSVRDDLIKGLNLRVGEIKKDLPQISDENFNSRCNQIILELLLNINDFLEELKNKYSKNEIGIIVATTNSGVEEYFQNGKEDLSELGNPALFIKKYLKLNGYYMTVSTACSSGIKAFSLAKDLLNSEILKAVIVVGVDELARISLSGFNSLELLSENQINSFSENRNGINISEGGAIFVLEKDVLNGIEIFGIGETSDTYHFTTPSPQAEAAKLAIQKAFDNSRLNYSDIDYINLHGTGTYSNDMMEANALYPNLSNIPSSSTKTSTGHALGASASLEVALCCELINSFDGRLYPHIYDNCYDKNLPEITFVEKNKTYKKCDICMCNSFGFGGSNAILILGRING